MLHVNITSLQKNLDNLNHELFQTLSYPPDILFLSEARLKMSSSLNVNLTEYQAVIITNYQNNAGGVEVYVADKFTMTLLEKNKLNSNCNDIRLKIRYLTKLEMISLLCDLSPL